jgi:hypothetical protein
MEDKKEVVEDNDIFVTEADVFDIGVKYYKKDGVVMVKDLDEAFDDKERYKEFSATFKYPDQSDVASIAVYAGKIKTDMSNGNIDVRDILNLEFGRLLTLIRKWTLKKEINNTNILAIHPKVIKSMIIKIREKIGMDGIF